MTSDDNIPAGSDVPWDELKRTTSWWKRQKLLWWWARWINREVRKP